MQSMRKSLIVGGNGALGKAMVANFKKSGWSVASLDIVSNPEACTNIIVDPDMHMKHQVESLLTQTRKANAEYDAIICVAGGFGCSSIKDDNIMQAYEEQDRINFQTALLAGHFASHMLAP